MSPGTLPKPRGGAAKPPAPAPHLFLALEAGRPVAGSGRFALGEVDAIEIGRGESRRAHRVVEHGARTLRIDVPDPWMSGVHARITRRGIACTLTDAGSRNGSLVNDVAVDEPVELVDGDRLEIGGTFFLFRAVVPSATPDVTLVPRGRGAASSVIPALEQQVAELARVATTDVAVVLHGPTGSGKEVTARAVHAWSKRRGAFVAVNCGAIPGNLVESELFGYKRGAFSGAAADKLGLIAAAAGGTLFLDEIGDLPAAIQPALLRALAERAIVPVGATEPVPVDFRLITATHRDLAALVARGEFREDLWARLAGFRIELPPLAERREDLATLIADLGERAGREVRLTAEAARALLAYAWPRNVRELEHVLGAALAVAGDAEIDVAQLPIAAPAAPAIAAEDPRKDELVAALAAHGGNVSAVARALGRPRSQIQRWMRRWGLR